MGDLVTYEMFQAKREAKTASNLTGKSEAQPVQDLEQLQAMLEFHRQKLHDVGQSMISKLTDVLIMVADLQDDGRVPMSYSLYQFYLEKGLPSSHVVEIFHDASGKRVWVDKAALEAVSHSLALGGGIKG